MKQYLEIESVFAREIIDSRGTRRLRLRLLLRVDSWEEQQFHPELHR